MAHPDPLPYHGPMFTQAFVTWIREHLPHCQYGWVKVTRPGKGHNKKAFSSLRVLQQEIERAYNTQEEAVDSPREKVHIDIIPVPAEHTTPHGTHFKHRLHFRAPVSGHPKEVILHVKPRKREHMLPTLLVLKTPQAEAFFQNLDFKGRTVYIDENSRKYKYRYTMASETDPDLADPEVMCVIIEPFPFSESIFFTRTYPDHPF